MLISIIVPVFNREETLHKCVDSILVQSYSEFELILIDDGSTDSSGEICDHYSLCDNRVRVIHSTNKGPSAARNLGLDIARGELIMFCDSDDCVHPDWIETLTSYMVNESVIMAFGNFNLIYSDGKKKEFSSLNSCVIPAKDFIFDREKYGMYYIWNCCYRKSNTRFIEDISLGEDALYNLSYVQSFLRNTDSEIAYTNHCVYDYFFDTYDSLSKSHKDKLLFWELLRKANQSFIDNYSYSEDDIKRFEYLLYYRECKQFFEEAPNSFSGKELRKLLSSDKWDDYCDSLHESKKWVWLCRRKSVLLFWIYYRLHLPLKKRINNGHD